MNSASKLIEKEAYGSWWVSLHSTQLELRRIPKNRRPGSFLPGRRLGTQCISGENGQTVQGSERLRAKAKSVAVLAELVVVAAVFFFAAVVVVAAVWATAG